MTGDHSAQVEELLADAAAEHERILRLLPDELRASLPVDAQGVTRAIDHLAVLAGFSEDERRELIRPHGLNPAVLHARVFGTTPLSRETVIGAFVEGARVRAEALATVADTIGGEPLGRAVRELLTEYPPPLAAEESGAEHELQATYAAQERAAVMIAAWVDEEHGSSAA
jgi:hypothetical protein